MRLGFVHGVLNTDNMLDSRLDHRLRTLWLARRFRSGLDTEHHGRPAATLLLCASRKSHAGTSNASPTHLVVLTLEMVACVQRWPSTTKPTSPRVPDGLRFAKFGFQSWCADDADLVETVFHLLYRAEIDLTIFFRRLSQIDLATPRIEVFDDAFYSRAKAASWR